MNGRNGLRRMKSLFEYYIVDSIIFDIVMILLLVIVICGCCKPCYEDEPADEIYVIPEHRVEEFQETFEEDTNRPVPSHNEDYDSQQSSEEEVLWP